MAELLHIFITPKPGVTLQQVEEKMSLGIDWFRYTDGCYFAYTSKSISVWNTRLLELVRPGGYLLIMEIDPYEYKGFMPKNLWPWLKDKKEKIYGTS